MPRPSAFGKTLAVSRQVVLKSGQRPGTHASKKRSTRPLASTIAFFRMWLTIASVCWTAGRAGRPPHHPCIERGRLLVSGMITPPPQTRAVKQKKNFPSQQVCKRHRQQSRSMASLSLCSSLGILSSVSGRTASHYHYTHHCT